MNYFFSGSLTVKWIKTVLTIHTSYLITVSINTIIPAVVGEENPAFAPYSKYLVAILLFSGRFII